MIFSFRKNARIVLVWALISLTSIEVSAQGATVKTTLVGDYLFVVDASFSMSREKQAAATVVSNLVQTGIFGRIQPGETWSLWTFNEQVHLTRFLHQTWAPGIAQTGADRAAQFLRTLRFEKQTRIDKAMAEILKDSRNSDLLTVCFLSDGRNPIAGTPFDRSINLIYKERYRDLRRLKKPFVTALVVKDGQFVAWSVTAGIDPLRIPQLPSAIQVSQPVENRLPQSTNVSASTPSVQKSAVAAPQVSPSTGRTNENRLSQESNPVKPPNEISQAPIENKKPAEETAKVEPTPARQELSTRVPREESVTGLSPAAPKNQEVSTPSGNLPGKTNWEVTQIPAPIKTTPRLESTNLTPSSSPTLPAPVLAKESTGAITLEVKAARAAETSSPFIPQQAATVPASNQNASSNQFLVFGLVLLSLATSLLLWSVRSGRSRRPVSLISRSLEKEKK